MAQDKIVEVADAVSTLTTTVADLAKELSQLKQRAEQAECHAPKSKRLNYAEITSRMLEPSRQSASLHDPHEYHPEKNKFVQIPKPMPPFQFQRRRRGHRLGIAGCGDLRDGSGFRAADEDLFIYRVCRDTNCEDIKRYIEDLNKTEGLSLTVKSIEVMSHADARTKSFKMTLKSEDLNTLMQGKMWPPSVRVRRFIAPRRSP